MKKVRQDNKSGLTLDATSVIAEKVQQLMEIDGEQGLAAKVCLLAGLTESEAAYCYNQEICDNDFCNCGCHKLHIINKPNGTTTVVMNWARENGRRIYFALMPTLLWERFRALTTFNQLDTRATDRIVKIAAGIDLSCICKIFYTVMRKTMDSGQIDILVGKAKPSLARFCLIFELDEMISNYIAGWQAAGIVLPVL